jgi:hypothetical protein
MQIHSCSTEGFACSIFAGASATTALPARTARAATTRAARRPVRTAASARSSTATVTSARVPQVTAFYCGLALL